MKQVLSLLLLFVSLNVCAQLRPHTGAISIGKIQAGILFDQNEKADYLGPNILNLGWTTLRGAGLSELDFEFIYYDQSYDREGAEQYQDERTRFSVEMTQFWSLVNFGRGIGKTHFGPTAAFMYRTEPTTSEDPLGYKETVTNYNLGFGLKALYLYEFNDNLFLNMSTRLTLADMGLETWKLDNPLLSDEQTAKEDFVFDFLRGQYQVNVGINFRF